MVGTAGFEPTTPCPPGRCATKLRYAPTNFQCGSMRTSEEGVYYLNRGGFGSNMGSERSEI